jgi:hypothetical protein
LVGLLVAGAVGLLLVFVFLFGENLGFGSSREQSAPREDGRGTTVPGAALMEARDTKTQSRLNQIRQFIATYRAVDPDGAPPPTLDAAGVPPNMQFHPIDERPFLYDPESGRVWTDYPGHEEL